MLKCCYSADNRPNEKRNAKCCEMGR